jgi:hypothetical protein
VGQQKRFTKEFEDEAVRLALTSGRTRQAILFTGVNDVHHPLPP